MPIPKKKEESARLTARERVYKALQSWIIDGTLMPEERLNDVEIANYFSVSRTPVREALQMLAEQKLVYMVPSSGTYVSSIDPDDLKHVYSLLGELQAYAVRKAVEKPEEAKRSGGKDESWEDAMKKLSGINEDMRYHIRRAAAVDSMKADSGFHHYLAELSGNPYVVNYTDQLMIQAHRNEILFFRNKKDREESCAAHEAIIRALREVDADKAAELLKENWKISIE